MELEISTSPRATWVWAPDAATASEVRRVLEARKRRWYPATGRGAEPRITDVDIGVDAMGALSALQRAGYTFRWHPTETGREPGDEIYDLSVAPARRGE